MINILSRAEARKAAKEFGHLPITTTPKRGAIASASTTSVDRFWHGRPRGLAIIDGADRFGRPTGWLLGAEDAPKPTCIWVHLRRTEAGFAGTLSELVTQD